MALTGRQKEQLHNLYKRQDAFRKIGHWAEHLGRNAVHTPVTVVESQPGLNRETAIDLMREIASTGIAEFKRGAGTHVSELTWKHDAREIGKAAREGLWGH